MARRSVNIYINGKEIAGTVKAIAGEKRKLTNELNKMVIGSEEYEAQMKKVRDLDNILKDHRRELSGVDGSYKKLNGTLGGVGKLAGSVGAGIAAAFAVGKIADFGVAMFNLGKEMEVLTKKAQTVFGEALPQVEAAAEANAAAMGLTISSYTDAAAAIGDLLIPMGFQREEAADISTELVNLSGALAEWTGGQVTAEQVSQILSKAMLGEREQLKTLGIAISEADVQARLAEKGLKGLTGQMLQQAKAAATLELITEKSADAQTAFAENSDTLLRKQTELRAQFENIRENIATALVPVFHRLLTAVAPIVEKIADFVKGATQGSSRTRAFGEVLKPFIVFWKNLFTALSPVVSVLWEVVKVVGGVLVKVFVAAQVAVLEFTNFLINTQNKINEFLGIKRRYEPYDVESFKKNLADLVKAREQSGVDKPLGAEKSAARGSSAASAAPAAGTSDKKALEKQQKEIEKHLTRLQETVAKFREEEYLAQLSDDERKIEQTRMRYDKEIAVAAELEAKGVKAAAAQRIELERLRDAEVQRVREELAEAAFEEELKRIDKENEELKKQREKHQEEKKEAEQRIKQATDQALLTEQEFALQQLQQFYDTLLAEAGKFGLDTVLIEEARRVKLAELTQKYDQEDIERAREAQAKKLQVFQQSFSALGGAFGQLYSTLAEEEGEFLILQKASTLAQIAVDTASAISSLVAVSEANPANAVTFGAAGIAQFAAGLIRILANIANARQVLSGATLPQKKEGGYFNVIGQDDGRRYNAQYIGSPGTGLLPGRPVVLASEAGPEYFVSNSDLRNPRIFNYVRAIENMKNRSVPQFQEGGFSTQPGTQGESAVMPLLLAAIQRLNARLDEGIDATALVPDETILGINNRFKKLNRSSGGVL